MSGKEHWIFGYGSLMWRPDFDYEEVRPARLWGFHRAMCVRSTHYRGCKDQPGLVLGLDRGGSCLGRAFRVAAPRWPEIKDRLDRRELITNIYLPLHLPVRLTGEAEGRKVSAYAYVVNRDHPQYCRPSLEEAAAFVACGVGQAGTSYEYLANTVAHLAQLGIREGKLHLLLDRARALRDPISGTE